MQVWRIIKTQIALRGIYVVHTDRCEMCPLPIHTKFYLSTLRTWREKNRQTALSDHLLTYITFFMIILTRKIFHFHIQVYVMCVSMSVRGIFEFDQPVNSVSRLNWEKYKIQNYIGHRKIHSTKKKHIVHHRHHQSHELSHELNNIMHHHLQNGGGGGLLWWWWNY